MRLLLQLICLGLLFISPFSMARSPLMPVKLDNPRATMKSYLEAIDDYKEGLRTNDPVLIGRIDDAARCFDLDHIPRITRQSVGRETAIIIKEVIDRVIVVDLALIPNTTENKTWRLKDTEISMIRIAEGPRLEQYLFDQDTVDRAKQFFSRVKHLPYLKGSGEGAGYEIAWQDERIPGWAKDDLWGLKKWQWVGLVGALLIGLLLKVLAEFIVHIFKRLTDGKEQSLRHRILVALEKPIGLIVATVFWFSSIHALRFEGTMLSILLGTIKIVFSINLIWAAYRMADVITDLFREVANKTESQLDDQLVPLVSKSLRIFVIVTGVLLTIQNLGFNVMSLMAGLGIGGLAFALAAKDTAANLFGSIMIFMDRPFQVGDWVLIGDQEGTIEEIGFRSTRVRTFYNSVISIPNSVVANANIDNMGMRRYRRTVANLGLTYDTPPAKVEAFIAGIKKIIEANEFTRKDYFHVVFKDYGDFSLNVMAYFFFETNDWGVELREKQNVFLAIYQLAEDIGVSFAFPTQSLHVESLPNPNNLQIPSPDN